MTHRRQGPRSLGDLVDRIAPKSLTKLRQFAAEAAALEVSDLLAISHPGKRNTLLLNLLRQAQMRYRDELIEMMLQPHSPHASYGQRTTRLEALHDQHREIEEALSRSCPLFRAQRIDFSLFYSIGAEFYCLQPR